jgi:hypothetical protein
MKPARLTPQWGVANTAGQARASDTCPGLHSLCLKEITLRNLALVIVGIVLGASVPANAQQPGPIATEVEEATPGSESFFPLWK